MSRTDRAKHSEIPGQNHHCALRLAREKLNATSRGCKMLQIDARSVPDCMRQPRNIHSIVSSQVEMSGDCARLQTQCETISQSHGRGMCLSWQSPMRRCRPEIDLSVVKLPSPVPSYDWKLELQEGGVLTGPKSIF